MVECHESPTCVELWKTSVLAVVDFVVVVDWSCCGYCNVDNVA